MGVSTASRISVLMASTMTRIKDLIEGTTTEELSENVFWITEHEREATKDEIIFKWIMLVSSTMLVVVIICVVVS